MLKVRFLRRPIMVEALTILSALQLFSQGLVPMVEGTGEASPYGISRDVVEGAARAGGALNPPRQGVHDSERPMPALSQVTATPAPQSSGKNDSNVAARVLDNVPCSDGSGGVIRYERIPGIRLIKPPNEGSEILSPDGNPHKVLSECVGFCLSDKNTPNQRNGCGSFEFVAGKQITSYRSETVNFEPSKCVMVETGAKTNYEASPDYSQFREICIRPPRSNNKPVTTTECSKRMYVMETYKDKGFFPRNAVQYPANTIEECQEICIHQQQLNFQVGKPWVCRSGTWVKQKKTCYLSSYTMRTHPHLFKANYTTDYFDNTCLSQERRCSKSIYIEEEKTKLSNPYVIDSYEGITMEDCSYKCSNAKTFFCRSYEYENNTKTCFLSMDDSHTKKLIPAASNSIYNEFICIDGEGIVGNSLDDSSSNRDTQPLSLRNFSPVKTAFTLRRNKKLSLNFGFSANKQQQRSRVTLAQCLDECLETTRFICKSVMYADQYQECIISQYDEMNGNLVYDHDYNYYRNLRSSSLSAGSSNSGSWNNWGSSSSGRSNFKSPERGMQLDQYYIRKTITVNSVQECMDKCEYETMFRCKGFNYRVTGGQFLTNCELSDQDTSGFSKSNPAYFGNNPSFDYYERRYSSASSLGSAGSAPWRSSGGSSWGSSGSRPWSTSGGSSLSSSGNRPWSSSGGSAWGSSGASWSSSSLGRPWGSSGGRPWGAGGSYTSGTHPYTGAGREIANQVCQDDGSMEFQIETGGPFYGRIYTYGNYDTCFTKGSGSRSTYLLVTPDRRTCGTSRYGDTTTNIVVVQFSESIMTMKDKRYNITCTVFDPVGNTAFSGKIGSGGGQPTPIEQINKSSRLQSHAEIEILYNGKSTSAIAVGDPLTFKIIPKTGRSFVGDIFASNIVAFDPQSGKQLQLIDRYGCPVDSTVFPALELSRSGDGLETAFSAFKMPQSDYLVFKADIKPCRNGCKPASCPINNGRDLVPSYGRRRRRSSDKSEQEEDPVSIDSSALFTAEEPVEQPSADIEKEHRQDVSQDTIMDQDDEEYDEETENVHGIFQVYMSRDEIPEIEALKVDEMYTVTASDYYSLMTALIFMVACLVIAMCSTAYFYRKYRRLVNKNTAADILNPNYSKGGHPNRMNFPGSHPRTVAQPARQVYFPSCESAQGSVDCEGGIIGPSKKSSKEKKTYKDPSEPIYTDPNLFEK